METINVQIVSGSEGFGLYFNNIRVAGNKPWGIGHTIAEFDVPIEEIKKLLDSFGPK